MNRRIGFAAFFLVVTCITGASAESLCDPARGAKLFETKCSLCHSLGQGTKVGPDLTGVVGRRVAGLSGFHYSRALKKAGGEWTRGRLDEWLVDPAKLYPGTAMAFGGLKSKDDRTDVVCFLAAASTQQVKGSTSELAKDMAEHETPKASGNIASLQRQISIRLRRLEQLWQGGDAKVMAETLYTDDAIIAGEGQEQAVRGRMAIGGLLETLIKDNKAVQIEIDATLPLARNAAATWITWTVTPRSDGSPFKMRSLVLWKKSAGDWRILSDMYSAGSLSKM